jgi:uncharacterized membrane protein YfcA
MTQILAAFIAIPYGLSVLMRGSDGLNRGRYTAGEAGMLAGIGGALILTSLAMLMGARYAGLLTMIALLVGVANALHHHRREHGRISAGAILGRSVLPGFLSVLILAGF